MQDPSTRVCDRPPFPPASSPLKIPLIKNKSRIERTHTQHISKMKLIIVFAALFLLSSGRLRSGSDSSAPGAGDAATAPPADPAPSPPSGWDGAVPSSGQRRRERRWLKKAPEHCVQGGAYGVGRACSRNRCQSNFDCCSKVCLFGRQKGGGSCVGQAPNKCLCAHERCNPKKKNKKNTCCPGLTCQKNWQMNGVFSCL